MRRTWRGGRSSLALVGVVVPAYGVAAYLPACLDSVLASTHRHLDVLVVDDGSPDESGDIADAYARRDPRVRVVHTDNRGLGAARNEGLRHVRGDLVVFADSDDAVPATAYAAMLASLESSGSDFVTGSMLRWEGSRLSEPRWVRRLHTPPRAGLRAADHPEILGDVFAWNKMFRRSFWDAEDLAFAEGVHYEDQPVTTRAYLRGRFDVIDTPTYHWRVRHDGTSITQQRSRLPDLDDRWRTKRLALSSVRSSDQAEEVLPVFLDRVLAGDLWRYFLLVPGCEDAWWDLLVSGVRDLWGDRSLLGSGLPPVHRLTAWLVEQDRRADATAVMRWVQETPGPAPRVASDLGPRIDVPVIDLATVPPEALLLRPHER